jgi:hypothetical protein
MWGPSLLAVFHEAVLLEIVSLSWGSSSLSSRGAARAALAGTALAVVDLRAFHVALVVLAIRDLGNTSSLRLLLNVANIPRSEV